VFPPRSRRTRVHPGLLRARLVTRDDFLPEESPSYFSTLFEERLPLSRLPFRERTCLLYSRSCCLHLPRLSPTGAPIVFLRRRCRGGVPFVDDAGMFSHAGLFARAPLYIFLLPKVWVFFSRFGLALRVPSLSRSEALPNVKVAGSPSLECFPSSAPRNENVPPLSLMVKSSFFPSE